MSFKTEIRAALGWNWSDGAADNDRLEWLDRLLEGNGPGQAEAAWHAEGQELSAGTSTTLDLSQLERIVLGSVNAVSLLDVKALLVVNRGDEGVLILGDAAVDPWWEPFGSDGDQLGVPPGSPLLLVNARDGWIVDATHRNLQLAAVGGDLTFDVAVVGSTTAAGSGA